MRNVIVLTTFLTTLLLAAPAYPKTEIYFSPRGGCEQQIVKMIDATSRTLDVAVYSINNSKIVAAIKNAKARGVKIRILTDRTQAAGNRKATLELKDNGVPIRVHSKNKIQHNKFAVFDGTIAVTGSFNWTKSAEESNEENCVILDDPISVTKFIQRFEDYLWVVNGEERSLASISKIRKKENKREDK